MITDSSTTSRKSRNRQIRRGVTWNALNLIVTRGLSIVSRLVLARFLVPEQFGLVALLVIAIGLANVVVDLGLKRALIQRPRDAQTLVRFDSAFWLHAGFGLAITVVFIAIIAPLLSKFFGAPQLLELALVMSWSIVFHSISIVPLVRLTRRLRFRPIVIAEILSVLLSAIVAVVLAMLEAGVWSLAAQQLVFFAANSTLIFAMARWRPRWRFSRAALMDILSFSAYTLVTKTIQYLRARSDMLIVGYMLGTPILGLYTMAYLATEVLRSAVSSVVNKIILPVLSRVQDDAVETARIFSKATRYLALLILPVSLALSLHADWLVELVFTEQWYEIKTPVRILALTGIVFSMSGPVAELLQAGGRPDLLFRLLITNFLFIALPLTVYLTHTFGLAGTASAVVASMIILRIRMHWVIYIFFPNVSAEMVKTILPVLITLAICMCLHAFLPENVPVLARIFLYFCLFYVQFLPSAKLFMHLRKRRNSA